MEIPVASCESGWCTGTERVQRSTLAQNVLLALPKDPQNALYNKGIQLIFAQKLQL